MSELAASLDEVNIVHIRGTAASGKTRLSELLRDHYRREGRKAFLITDWVKLNPTDSWGSFAELIKNWDEELRGSPINSFTSTSSEQKLDPSWVLTTNMTFYSK